MWNDGTRRAMRIAAVAAMVVGAFFVGRWSTGVDGAERRLPADAAASDAATSPDTGGASPGRLAPAQAGPGGVTRANGALPVTPIPQQPPALPDVPVSAAAPGPKPLLPSDLPKFAKGERLMASEGGTGSDLLDLSRDEPQDDDARRIEALIAQAIRDKGGRYTALRLAPPRCTRSVCVMRAIGVGTTQDPRSDWQRLSATLMNQPWFREVFDDMRGMVTGDRTDTVYLTLFIRCAPGTCQQAGK